MRYLIDGYNFFFRLKYLSSSLQEGREHFIQLLNQKCAKNNLLAIVVFDSDFENAREYASTKALSHLEVRYSPQHKTADDYIVEHLKFVKHPSQWTLVSSDNALRFQCQDLGTRLLTVEEFFHKYFYKKTDDTSSLKPAMENSKDLERLLKIFEDKFRNQ